MSANIDFSKFSSKELNNLLKKIETCIKDKKNEHRNKILSSFNVNDVVCWDEEGCTTILIIERVTDIALVGKKFNIFKNTNKVSNVDDYCHFDLTPWWSNNYKKLNCNGNEFIKIIEQHYADIKAYREQKETEMYADVMDLIY